jgi:alkaline phosphatase
VDWNQVGADTLQKLLQVEENTNKARNVIFFLGDGMGIPTITASRIYKGQKAGNPGEETVLNFEKFSHTALAKVGRIYITSWD